MSFIHYLSIGRFEACSMRRTTLGEPVVAHIEPGGLARLGAPAAPTPLTDVEVDRLERVLKEAWDLRADLRSYLQAGVLTIPYTSEGMYEIAWPLALVAREVLGLTVAERGQAYSDEKIRDAAERSRAANAATRALHGIADGGARVRAVAAEVLAGRRSPDDAHELLEGLGSEIVPAVASLLASEEAELQEFACHALAAQGAGAVPAIAALAALVRRTKLDETVAVDAVVALARIGPAAEAALACALAHREARQPALMALAAITGLSPETRARIAPLAQGDDEMAQLARHALGESTIAKRLAALRARHGNIEVPGDLDAWARALPEEQTAAVVAAALDARSARSMPRAGALSAAIAAAIRGGSTSDAFLERLDDEHDTLTIPWPDYEFQHAAVAGLTDRDALVWTICELENPTDMFLVLRETR